MSVNCWEYKRCGREPGGLNVSSEGICPAHDMQELEGRNGGKGGGRSCWRVPELCGGGKGVPHWAEKGRDCLSCGFFKRVSEEQGPGFVP